MLLACVMITRHRNVARQHTLAKVAATDSRRHCMVGGGGRGGQNCHTDPTGFIKQVSSHNVSTLKNDTTSARDGKQLSAM